MSNSYGIFLNNQKCLSLSTHNRTDGKYDIYVHAVGDNTHEHLYFQEMDGQISNQGVSLKNKGHHLGDNIQLNDSSTRTLFIAKLIKKDDSEKYNCSFIHTAESTKIVSDQSTSREFNNPTNKCIYLDTDNKHKNYELSFALLSKENVNKYSDDKSKKIIKFGNEIGICISVTGST